MKRLTILFVIFFLLGCSDRNGNEISKVNNHYFSDETACAFIFYDVEGAPELTIQDRTIDYRYGEQNILATSSPLDFGWASEEASGYRTLNFYKSDGLKIPLAEEPPIFTGGIDVDGIEYTYTVIHFNDREECFSNDINENNEIFTELVRKIYNN